MATPYCTLAEVAEVWPFNESFTATTYPPQSLVQTYINQAARDLDTAMTTSGYYDLPITEDDEPEAYGWLNEANVEGALQRLGRWLFQHGPIRRGQESAPPFQDRWPKMLARLEGGDVQWVDKSVEPISKQIPTLSL